MMQAQPLGVRWAKPEMWLWLSKPTGSHFGVDAPPILEPILVGIALGVRDFDP